MKALSLTLLTTLAFAATANASLYHCFAEHKTSGQCQQQISRSVNLNLDLQNKTGSYLEIRTTSGCDGVAGSTQEVRGDLTRVITNWAPKLVILTLNGEDGSATAANFDATQNILQLDDTVLNGDFAIVSHLQCQLM